MDKQKLHNKAIQDLVEDAKDGRVKKATLDKVKKATKKQYHLGSKSADTKEDLAAKLGISMEDVEFYIEKGKCKLK